MSTALGKRKRVAPKEKEEGESDAADLQAILQRHFEARFKPIAVAPVRKAEDEEDEDDDDETMSDLSDDDDEWGGLSDDGDNGLYNLPTIEADMG